MSKRFRQLPSGWYPDTPEQVHQLLAEWSKADMLDGYQTPDGLMLAGIAPHAGWYFSGRLAWRLWRSACPADITVILGGHLPPGATIHVQQADFFEAPGCWLEASAEIRADLIKAFDVVDDYQPDNTIEVQLPMAAQALARSKLLCLRVPADTKAVELGVFLAEWAASQGQRLFVAGSADLTHYGPDYSFAPAGDGETGREWASRNDQKLGEAMLALDAGAVLEAAERSRATCSAGAIVSALTFAKRSGSLRGYFLGSASSFDLRPAASFVGYAAIGYQQV